MSIPDASQESVWIDLALLDFRPDARVHAEPEIAKLSKSLSEKQLQNVIVSKQGVRYQVIAGVGRVLAARKLGWKQIRADAYEGLTEFQKLAVMFSENENRENAPALYQAQLLKEMMSNEHFNQEQLSEKMGKDASTVSKYLSLFGLSEKIWEQLNRFNELGIAHFMQIIRLENKDDQFKFAEISAQNDLSVKELKVLIDKALNIKNGAKKPGRPKKAKSLAPGSFDLKQKGDALQIRASLSASGNLDDFLSRLRDEIVQWRSRPAAKGKGRNSSVNAAAPPPEPGGATVLADSGR